MWDLIFANGVLLHFTRNELTIILDKLVKSLAPNGTLSFTLKSGEGEEWSRDKTGDPRFFTYWTQEKIMAVLKYHGFEKINGSSVLLVSKK